MNSAHTIVSAIVRDIESRIDRTAIEQTVIDAFTRSQEEIGHRVGADCRSDLPPIYADRLNEILGPEFMETLNQGRGSTLGRRNRARYHYLLTRLARFVDSYRFYVTAAQQARVAAACLEQIKHELMESQVAQLQEIETLELRLQR